MSWTSPNCDRVFKNGQSNHHCQSQDINRHFENKLTSVYETYLALMQSLHLVGDLRINIVKNALILSSKSTFMIIKPKKQWLDIEFLLEEETYKFPVNKVVRTSQNHYAHFVRIEAPSDIDAALMQLLRSAYELMS